MVKIPAGEFTLGLNPSSKLIPFMSDKTSGLNAQPKQILFLETFYIDRHETTYEDFINFKPKAKSIKENISKTVDTTKNIITSGRMFLLNHESEAISAFHLAVTCSCIFASASKKTLLISFNACAFSSLVVMNLSNTPPTFSTASPTPLENILLKKPIDPQNMKPNTKIVQYLQNLHNCIKS